MNRKDFHEQGNANSLLELRIKGTSENDKKGNFPFSNANKYSSLDADMDENVVTKKNTEYEFMKIILD